MKAPPTAPLELTAADLAGARVALAAPARSRLRMAAVLLCAALMTAAALALCAVVVLAGGSARSDGPAASVREGLRR